MLHTPLHSWHVAQGAKLAPFAGYEMPISYAGVLSEHEAVRERVGLFDISHMGEIRVRGGGARDFLQRVASNDVDRLEDGRAQYSLLLDEAGFPIDDILVYRLKEEDYLLCVNAANIAKDWAWLNRWNEFGAALEDQSAATGMIALQGPGSFDVLQRLGFSLRELPRFSTKEFSWNGQKILVSRTGYTGEAGAEFFLDNEAVPSWWSALLDAGASFGIVPVGLGARDTLRLEMGYPLYGHELSPEISPLEAGLSWVVDFDKGDFIGKSALQESRSTRRVFALTLLEPGIPREGMVLKLENGEVLGRVLSGTMSPTLKQGIASVLVDTARIGEAEDIFVDIRGRLKKARLQKFPLIKK